MFKPQFVFCMILQTFGNCTHTVGHSTVIRAQEKGKLILSMWKKELKSSRVITDLLVSSQQYHSYSSGSWVLKFPANMFQYLSYLLCSFCKGYNARHALMQQSKMENVPRPCWKSCNYLHGPLKENIQELSLFLFPADFQLLRQTDIIDGQFWPLVWWSAFVE